MSMCLIAASKLLILIAFTRIKKIDCESLALAISLTQANPTKG
jgi:hypothetical protein